MEKKPFGKRSIAMLIFVFIFFSVYVGKLFDDQIINGQAYRDYADRTSVRTIDIDAARGEIIDRNGEKLATNRLSRTIIFDKAYLPSGEENNTIIRLVRLFQERGEEWIDELPIVMGDNGSYQFAEDSESAVAQLKKRHRFQQYSTAEQIMAELVKKYNCEEYSKEEARCIVSVRNQMEKNEFSLSNPYTFAEDLSVDTVSIVMENSDLFPGASVKNTSVREYVAGDLAAPIIGHIDPINAAEYKKSQEEGGNYKITDLIGRFGIEQIMEDELRGTRGKQAIETNNKGAVLGLTDLEFPVPGNTVRLTIDSKLQRVTQDALAETVEKIKATGEQSATKDGADCSGGAAIVMDINNFEILAMATYPTFDLSTYTEDYAELSTSAENQPLINRAIDSIYPPGSVMKVATAIAGLETGEITPTTTFLCKHIFNYGTSRFQCLGWHGNTDVVYALQMSCNIFFYQTSLLVGIDTMNEYSRKLGLGEKTGIEFENEATGILAGRNDPETIKEGGDWYPGNTLQASIGQSHNAFTPLQIASYIATVANGGTRYKAHLIKEVLDYGQTTPVTPDSSENPEILDQLNLSESTMKAVREGMRRAMTDGSAAYVFRDYPVEVAGKTGTSQTNSGSDHGLIACYGPYEDPEIVVVVVLEHGVHGYTGAETVKKIMDAYFFDDYGGDDDKDSDEALSLPDENAALAE